MNTFEVNNVIIENLNNYLYFVLLVRVRGVTENYQCSIIVCCTVRPYLEV